VAGRVAIRRPTCATPRGKGARLRDLTPDRLAAWIERELGGPRYRAVQVFQWLHRHRVDAASAMTNLGEKERARLAERADLTRLRLADVARSRDGTRKLRLETTDGHAVESVLIPNEERGLTQCVSSTIGCPLSCTFCATASLGLVRSLTTSEIVDQVYCAQDLLDGAAAASGTARTERITNLVLMGMGEPLLNFNRVRDALRVLTDEDGAAIAGRRITVSTAGLVPGIERFARAGLGDKVGLAVSLNATTDATRDVVMPINRRWNIAALLDAIRRVPTSRRRWVTFEYVLLAEVNDSDGDARRLARLVGDMSCHVNVIPYNEHPHAPYRRPSQDRIVGFAQICRDHGLRTFVRTARGEDIAAACGQLALEGSA
jgi:23S rRNA (adenine2503-C2)-methyltransferase